MITDTKGTYTIEEKEDQYTLSIDYTYYHDTGTYDQPPEEDMEIKSVYLNGADITAFFLDWAEDGIYEQVIEYARENG